MFQQSKTLLKSCYFGSVNRRTKQKYSFGNISEYWRNVVNWSWKWEGYLASQEHPERSLVQFGSIILANLWFPLVCQDVLLSSQEKSLLLIHWIVGFQQIVFRTVQGCSLEFRWNVTSDSNWHLSFLFQLFWFLLPQSFALRRHSYSFKTIKNGIEITQKIDGFFIQ